MTTRTTDEPVAGFPNLTIRTTERFDDDVKKRTAVNYDFDIRSRETGALLVLIRKELVLRNKQTRLQITRSRFESLNVPPNSSAVLHITIPIDPGSEELTSSGGGTRTAAFYDPQARIKPDTQLYLFPFPLNVDVKCTQSFQTLPDHGSQNTTHTGDDKFAVDFLEPASFGNRGMEVFAARDGIVVAAEDGDVDHPLGYDPQPADKERGNMVKVIHNDGTYTKYGHIRQRSLRVRVRDVVRAGQTVLALSGNSGYSRNSHLHFAVEKIKPVSQQEILNHFTSQRNLTFTYETLPFKFDGGGRGIEPHQEVVYKRTR